jgi:magnesium-transporting ATPase (P-type)
VVYTGLNTKIFQNSKTPPIKVSNVMRLMNHLLYSLFLFQLILCLFFSILFIIWQNANNKNISYLEKYNPETNIREKLTTSFGDLFLKFFTFLVAYSHLIPISLYVALEIVKLIQSILIFYDEKCVDPVSKKPAVARTSDLIEELGQVEFIFSDKTGTLTKNEMEFRKCYINNTIYGEAQAEGDLNAKCNNNNNENVSNVNISKPGKQFLPKANKPKDYGTNNNNSGIGYTNISNNLIGSSLTVDDKFNTWKLNENNTNNNDKLGTYVKNSVNGDARAFYILTGKAKEINENDTVLIEDFFTILSVCHSAYIDFKDDKKTFQV